MEDNTVDSLCRGKNVTDRAGNLLRDAFLGGNGMIGHGRIQDVVRGSLVPGACVRRAQARKRRRRRPLESRDPTATGTYVRASFPCDRPATTIPDVSIGLAGLHRGNAGPAPPPVGWGGGSGGLCRAAIDLCGSMTEFRISERCMFFLCRSDSGFRLFFGEKRASIPED
jgi:hypothetical protein